MIVLRNACKKDLEGICQLAEKTTIGLTTLPNNKKLLKQSLDLAVKSFAKKVSIPEDEYYLFVLEDLTTHKIIGTSAILAATGHRTPFYSYHLATYSRKSPSLNLRNDYQVLNLVNDYQGRTEICTLFLDPDYRRKHIGLLLSKARFLFIAQQQERFASDVIAEMRGYFNEGEISLFWEHVGRHFFQMTYAEVDQLVLATNNQFIEDLMPQHPIYVSLLPREVQETLGKPHTNTAPAMNMLIQEGFRYRNYIHIFDAGPIIEASIENIQTIAMNRECVISSITDEVKSNFYILTNNQLNFRAIAGFAVLHDDNSCVISKEAAKTLQVKCGDTIRVAPLRPKLA